MPITLDGNSFMDVEINGENMKSIQLNGETVFTRIDLPTITRQPAGGQVNTSQTFTASIAATTGDGTLTYAWYLNGALQPNSNKASYVFPARGVGTYSIYCKATNERGAVNSSTVSLKVVAATTNTLNVGYHYWGDFIGMQNFGAGQVPIKTPPAYIGSISPNTVPGLSGTINRLMTTVQRGGGGACDIAVTGNHSGRRVRVEITPSIYAVSSPGVYSDGLTAFNLGTGSVYSWLNSNNGKSIGIKIQVV